MATNLPTNVDASYADDSDDPSVATHQQHHDEIHAYTNGHDSAADPHGDRAYADTAVQNATTDLTNKTLDETISGSWSFTGGMNPYLGTGKLAGDAPSTYPAGISVAVAFSANGWPSDLSVLTMRPTGAGGGTSRTSQIATKSRDPADMWTRSEDGADGWGVWRQVAFV